MKLTGDIKMKKEFKEQEDLADLNLTRVLNGARKHKLIEKEVAEMLEK